MVQHHYFFLCFLILQVVGVVVCKAWMDTSLNLILKHLEIDEGSVSEHQLLKLHSPERLHKRDLSDGTQIHFKAFKDEYKLSLYSRESFLVSKETQVCFASYASGYANDVKCRILENAMEGVGTPMEDINNQASIMVGSDDSGRMTVNGNFLSRRDNTRLVIRSLPEDVVDRYLRSRRSATDDLYSHSTNSTNHVVLKLNHDDLQMDHIYAVQSRRDSHSQIIADGNSNYTNHNEIDTVYPKILVHVHHNISGNRPSDRTKSLLRYILTFWNGVDLIYRSVKNPKVRFHIGIIMIAEEPRATPYIWHNIDKNDDVDYMGDDALYQASLFYYAIKDSYSFDIAVTMTTLSLLTRESPTDFTRANGIAFMGGACGLDDRARQHKGVALVRDSGLYAGIAVAAHEIAHLMGAYHETDTPHSRCPIQRGLLMDADQRLSKNWTRISMCSKYDFAKSLEAGNLTCLYDEPSMVGKILPNVLAGETLDLNQMCEDEGLGPLCEREEINPKNSCSALYCQPKNGGDWCIKVAFAIPAGSPCSTPGGNASGICLNYECMPI